MTPRRVRIWLTGGLVVVLLALAVRLLDVGAVLAQLAAADWRYAAAASLALLGGLGLYAVRWRVLLGNRPRWLATFQAANAGHAVNLLLPLRAGEAARLVVLRNRAGVAAGEAAPSVVVERLLEQVMRLLALTGAVALGVNLQVTAATVSGLLVVVVVGIAGLYGLRGHRAAVLASGPRWAARLPGVDEARARRLLESLLRGFGQAGAGPRLRRALGWSVLTWGCFWVFHILVLLALPTGARPGQVLAVSLGALALVTPSAPTQPGIFHASLVVPLVLLGYDETTVAAYAVLLHGLEMFWMLGLGFWGLAGRGKDQGMA